MLNQGRILYTSLVKHTKTAVKESEIGKIIRSSYGLLFF
jgi:hypothetical protein